VGSAVFVGELGEHDVVAPLAGDLEEADAVALAAEAGALTRWRPRPPAASGAKAWSRRAVRASRP
jgi:hypothetical protein